jgi:signal transduction histidine kinase
MGSPEHAALTQSLEVGDPEVEQSAEFEGNRKRARVLHIATLALCGLGLVSLVQYWLLGMRDMSLVLLVTMAAGVANLVLLHRTQRHRLCGHLALLVLTSLLLFTNAGSGGFRDPSFAWFYLLPLAAAVILGFRGAGAWLVVTLTVTLGFWTLDSQGLSLPSRVPAELQTVQGLFTRVTAILALCFVALSFVTGQRRAERSLAGANAELRRESAYVRLLEYAAVAANEAATLDGAMQEGVKRICEAMDWPVGHIYVEADGLLQRTGGFCAEGEADPAALPGVTLAATSPTAEELPLRVLASGHPEGVYDLTVGSAAARKLGLHTAFAVPVLTHGRVAAVLEFGLREHMAPNVRLLEILALVGVQIGRVAERMAVQQRFRQAQKMEAIGRLSAGVAHEINNPMAYVRSNLSQLGSEWRSLRSSIEKLDDPEPFATCLEDCEEIIDDTLEGVERTVAIVRDMKKFSQAGDDGREPSDLHEIVDSALRVASAQAPSGVDLRRREGDGLPPVPCAANQLHQVLVNLVVNAIEAVGPNGCIDVTTCAEGDFAVIQVEDDGPGMSEETRERLFDPFFTTKQAGEGTGLGLAISYEIVRNHAGEIRVISAPGAGTVMEVRLPLESAGAAS